MVKMFSRKSLTFYIVKKKNLIKLEKLWYILKYVFICFQRTPTLNDNYNVIYKRIISKIEVSFKPHKLLELKFQYNLQTTNH